MDNQMCRDCTHYVQHFVLYRGNYITAWCGHCIHPRLKHRRPDHKACRYYQKRIA